MDLIVLPGAKKDINRLFNFLVEKNPNAAEKAMIVIDESFDLLLKFPESGILMKDQTKRRQFFVSFGQSGYEMRYRIEKEKIIIIRLWHGKEKRI